MPVYEQLSERFSDFAFFDLSGDESPELRQLMKVGHACSPACQRLLSACMALHAM